MRKVPNWVRPLLLGGGALNMFLAVILLLMPVGALHLLFGGVAGLQPQALQLYGILLAALAVGYIAVGMYPLNNPAVLLMGMLANLLFALFLLLVSGVQFWQHTALMLWVLLSVLWCAVLAAVLYKIAKARQAPQTLAHAYQEPLSKTLTRFRTQRGKSLLHLSNEQPTLVVFLRQFGSTFSRETLDDIRQQRKAIESRGAQIVLVHLAEEAEASALLEKYELSDLHHISDPSGIMYNAFGLHRGHFHQLFGVQSWVRRFVVGVWRQHGLGHVQGDSFRMPGVFLISKGEIMRSYRHQSASERPDYRRMASEQAA